MNPAFGFQSDPVPSFICVWCGCVPGSIPMPACDCRLDITSKFPDLDLKKNERASYFGLNQCFSFVWWVNIMNPKFDMISISHNY